MSVPSTRVVVPPGRRLNRRVFAQARADGANLADAAMLAGSTATTRGNLYGAGARLERDPRVQRLIATLSNRAEAAAQEHVTRGWRKGREYVADLVEGKFPDAPHATRMTAFDSLARMHRAYGDDSRVEVNHVLTFRQLAPGNHVDALAARGIVVPLAPKPLQASTDAIPPVSDSPPGPGVARQEGTPGEG